MPGSGTADTGKNAAADSARGMAAQGSYRPAFRGNFNSGEAKKACVAPHPTDVVEILVRGTGHSRVGYAVIAGFRALRAEIEYSFEMVD
jgi:hypothetical protein